MIPNYNLFVKGLVEIGQLQILRKLITKQIFLSARVESGLYQSCLETLNYTVLHNLDEIRETAKRTYVDRDEELGGIMDADTLNQSRMMNP
jgi:Hereditary spastic paraplegia protein strumpellin